MHKTLGLLLLFFLLQLTSFTVFAEEFETLPNQSASHAPHVHTPLHPTSPPLDPSIIIAIIITTLMFLPLLTLFIKHMLFQHTLQLLPPFAPHARSQILRPTSIPTTFMPAQVVVYRNFAPALNTPLLGNLFFNFIMLIF
jgi:hypothetical protein